jgi:uncharacterized membrane protein SpoIIM required for sporulation
VILDLQRFIADEQPYWDELAALLDQIDGIPGWRPSLDDAQRLHYLYRRASADLSRVTTFAAEPDMRGYLEALVARAYTEIHSANSARRRLKPVTWMFVTFPQAFRRQVGAFWLALGITLAGASVGGLLAATDVRAKGALLPFPHLQQSPAERVAAEEKRTSDRLQGGKATFAAFLMTHNTKVSILALALGMTWGIGTIVMLFYNGIILGFISLEYILGGQAAFLVGWLLPHGSIEIPAILLAGQAGLVLAGAVIGWGTRAPLRERLQTIAPDLVTIIGGVAVMLVWAGIVESFLSQYHEPVLPYSAKILLGSVELIALIVFLSRSGRGAEEPDRA